MTESDFPALYRSADRLSLRAQRSFFLALGAQLVLLVVAAGLSVFNLPHWGIAVAQAAVLLGALGCSIFLFAKRPDRQWYAGRAVAESIKTITWRYVSLAAPFESRAMKSPCGRSSVESSRRSWIRTARGRAVPHGAFGWRADHTGHGLDARGISRCPQGKVR